MIRMRLLTLVLFLPSCVIIAPPVDPRAEVFVVGDSILAWHRGSARSIPDVAATQSGLTVTNQSIAGAAFLGSRGIPTQFVSGDWDIVVLTGGGNDIGAVCGTDREAEVLSGLISSNGQSGRMPDFARRLIAEGHEVIIVGYFPISIAGGPFAPCRETLDALKDRQRLLADQTSGVTFVDTADVIAPDDLALYDEDLVHPSVLGAARIGSQLAVVLDRLQN